MTNTLFKIVKNKQIVRKFEIRYIQRQDLANYSYAYPYVDRDNMKKFPSGPQIRLV